MLTQPVSKQLGYRTRQEQRQLNAVYLRRRKLVKRKRVSASASCIPGEAWYWTDS